MAYAQGGNYGQALALPTAPAPLAHRIGLSGATLPRVHPLRRHQWRLNVPARWRARWLIELAWDAEPCGSELHADALA